MVSELAVIAGLLVVFVIILIGPFRVPVIEHNLEVFLFFAGVVALTLSGMIVLPGVETGWTQAIVIEALTAPLRITEVFGIPVGIVQVVFIVGLIIYVWHGPIQRGISKMTTRLSLSVMIFFLTVLLGLVSSIISAIIASIILVEVLCALPLQRKAQVAATVAACFSIGLGAALTPLGEPLSTIVVSKLVGPPHFASFFYLFDLLAVYVLPGVIAFGIIGVVITRKYNQGEEATTCEIKRESIREVILRALKVYVFIVALVLLGEGFKPLILNYVIYIPSEGLYWVNTVSAVLDNATLAAAEVGPVLSDIQIKAVLMSLLVSGGMLIPGNIPNIIAAGKLRITSKEWAKFGVLLGIPALIIYFAAIFIPVYL
jgi:predicted cation transporter